MRLCCICVLAFVFFEQSVLSDRYLACKTPSLKNGRIRSRQRGRSIKYVCSSGYQLAGERNAFCIHGKWDVDVPKCVRGTCPKKESPPDHGSVLPSHNGAVLNFYCQPGYELSGPGAVFCDGLTWDNHKPFCLASNTKPKLFCDFEDINICHWTHDLNHDMDWVRDSYKTPTGYSMPTGPSYDHTKGKGSNGHYMYIESSLRRINDTARLVSPIFEKSDGSICLEFWYHMYGNTTGTLRTYMRKISDPWPPNSDNVVFSKSGNQGDTWYRGLIDLGHIAEDFQIIMEGVRGNGYVSDIAIDDINIIPNCVFEDHSESTTELDSLVSEMLPTIESCANRCGQKAFGNGSSQVIACDCDYLCFETSRCCPDFIEACLSGYFSTEWSTSSDGYMGMSEELPASSTDDPTENIGHETRTPNTTPAPTLSTKRQSVPVTKTFTFLPKVLKKITKKPQISQKAFTIPTLIILKPPTTPQIVQLQSIVPRFPPNKNTSKINFLKPKRPTTVSAYNDDLDVPTKAPGNSDEELFLMTPASPIKDSNDINDASWQEKEDFVEKISNKKEYPLEISDIGKSKPEPRQNSEQSNTNLVSFAIATVCVIAILAILAGVALMKFKCVSFRNKRMTSGQGDSQSDVRFLTADEVLDFNMDKDYDEL